MGEGGGLKRDWGGGGLFLFSVDLKREEGGGLFERGGGGG